MTLKVVKRKVGEQMEFRIPEHAESPALLLTFAAFLSGQDMRAAVNAWAKPYGAALED